MAHRNSPSFRSNVVTQRRKTLWLGRQFSTAEIAVAANSFIVDSVLTTAEKALRPFTITRTIGLLSVRSDQTAASEIPFGAIGALLVSDKASALGATAIPDPVTFVADDYWFVYQAWVAYYIAGTQDQARQWVMPFESKAQRKVQEGDDMLMMFANGSAAFGCQYTLNYRVLIKTH